MAKKSFILSFARIKKRRHKKIKIDDIISFFQQLSVLLNSGSTLLHSLELCSKQCQSEKFSKVLKDIANKVAGGVSFHAASSEYPKIFKSHWIQVMNTGEVTGQLGPLMSQLMNYIQTSHKTQGKVKSAMVYPAILLGVAVLATVIMLWKVIPTFAEFFKDFNAKLPAITEVVIKISDTLREKGLTVLAVFILLSFGFYMLYRTKGGKRAFDSALLTIPVIGDLLIQSTMEKFATNFALLLKSGTPLLESLRTVQEVFSDNAVYYDALAEIYGSVSRGGSLVASMNSTELFLSMLTDMVKIGEESGKLAEVLEQAANFYREKVEATITQVTGMIEPLIVIGMGVVFAGLLASVYIPMFQLASGPGGG